MTGTIPLRKTPAIGISWHLVLIITLTLSALFSCGSGRQVTEGRSITDSAGRQVTIPDTVRSVIALKAGTMRLLSYMKVTHLVSHIEGSEQRRNVLYLFANPHLRELPVIGAGNNYDTELLAAAAPDLILATFMSPAEADRLQRLTRRPVMLLEYADLGERREQLYNTLSLLGEVFHRQSRADSLIDYIERTIDGISSRAASADAGNRSAAADVVSRSAAADVVSRSAAADAVSRSATPDAGNRSAYVGGVAYNGAHGLNSTEPDYPPFSMLSIKNVAAGLGLRNNENAPGHEVVFIDPEQLMKWDPDILFLDAAGRNIWEEELSDGSVYTSLKAIREGNAYTVLPYNWNTTNYENLLCNAWFIGSVLMPDAFGDTDYREKSREIFLQFYGKDIYDQAMDYYRPFMRYEKAGRGKEAD